METKINLTKDLTANFRGLVAKTQDFVVSI